MSVIDRFRRQTQQTKGAVMRLHDAFCDLRKLGWSEPMYIPDDLDEIEVVELGSCGVFKAHRIRLDADRSLWFSTDGEDEYPCRPLVWRRVPVPRLTT